MPWRFVPIGVISLHLDTNNILHRPTRASFKRNRKLQYTVNRAIYVMRNRIERFFNRLKESRRVATRYDHTAESFLGFVKLAAIKIWIHFVHAT